MSLQAKYWTKDENFRNWRMLETGKVVVFTIN
jgi:hypothetical protein